MKIDRLHIHEFRGIRDLELNFQSSSAVIYGPNGAGKSGVVDAIEFLLTGEISRLSGEGTSGISIKEFGRHFDADINDSFVSGVLKDETSTKRISIKRLMNDPKRLDYDIEMTEILKPILAMSKNGHFILTRKNLLKYVTSTAGDRGKQIQALLNLDDIEDVRSSLKKVRNSQDNDLKTCKNKLLDSEKVIAQNLNLQKFSELDALSKINELRSVFGGMKLTDLPPGDMTEGIHLPESASGLQSLNTTAIETDLEKISQAITDDSRNNLQLGFYNFLESTETLLSNPDQSRLVNLIEFLGNGIDLIDETGDCPFCETAWEPGKLKEFIEIKLMSREEEKTELDLHKQKANKIQLKLTTLLSDLKNIENKLRFSEVYPNAQNEIAEWKDRLQKSINILSSPLDRSNVINLKSSLSIDWIVPEFSNNLIKKIYDYLNTYKTEKTPEQKAWDSLTKLHPLFESWRKNKTDYDIQEAKLKRINLLYGSFIEARDKVLGDLYDSVTNRFVYLYKLIHGKDEENFSADLIPKESNLDFKVDFYNRGKQPPQALHSEGHQDSMGVCLYLALLEKLTNNDLQLVVLDDVVMSVDSNHRQRFSEMLGKEFPTTQFVITTHDKIWAGQLSNGGIVKNQINFKNWSLETGPCVGKLTEEVWNSIEHALKNNHVDRAAQLLRRKTEENLSAIAANLEAEVPYRGDANWDAGVLTVAVCKRYKELLELSAKANNKWGNQTEKEKVEKCLSDFISVEVNKNKVNWTVNPNVHFNEWAQFSPNDLRPVVEFTIKFFEFFYCKNCKSLIKVSRTNKGLSSLGCNCKKILFNLE